MPSIVAYRKATDEFAVYSARLPEGAEELATLDGLTFVSLPDGAVLPAEQPSGIQFNADPITTSLLGRLVRSSPLAIAARRTAEDDVANGRRTRAQANTAVRVRMRELALGMTRRVAVDTIRAEAERRKLQGGFAAPALPNGTVRWLPISAYVIAMLAAAKQATNAQVAGAKILALDGIAYPLNAARAAGAFDAMWTMAALIDDAADAAVAALPTTAAALEDYDFAAIPWPAQYVPAV